jgi:hypothetical protein
VSDLFLLFLGAAWLLLLWPAAVRARRNTPLSTATRFRRRMSLIAPKAPHPGRWVVIPSSSGAWRRRTLGSLRRRKQVFVALLLAAPLTALAGLLWGGHLWAVHICADAALGGYVTFLLHSKRRHAAEVKATSARRRVPELDFTAPVVERRRA